MRSRKPFKLAYSTLKSLFQLSSLFFMFSLQMHSAFAEPMTIALPVHSSLPLSKSALTESTPIASTSSITSSPAIDQSATSTQSATNTQPNTTTQPENGQLPTSSVDRDKPSSNAPKLKGRVIVPANPYRGVNNSSTPFAPEGTLRRGLPAPLDPVFPSTEYVGIASQIQIGIPDQDPMFPLEKAIYKACPLLAKYRIKIYGWANPGVDYSTSHHANTPLSYFAVPRHIELDQLVLRAERVPDTVQNEHMDWGFRTTWLYGIDYRWTTSQGWYPASGELLKHNQLYGLDPVELYTLSLYTQSCSRYGTQIWPLYFTPRY